MSNKGFLTFASCVTVLSLACLPSTLNAGLLAHYAFDGNANDSSGNLNNAVENGGVGYTAPGGGFTGNPGDQAVNFNAAGQAVSAPAANLSSITTNNAASVSLWIFGDAALQPRNDTTFSFNQNGSAARQFQTHSPWSDGTVYFDTGGGTTNTTQRVTTSPPAADWEGDWNHYLFIKNGNDKDLWINGVQIIDQNGTATANIGAFNNAIIGGEDAAGTNNYRGFIDDFGIWDEGLNAAEAQGLYNLAVEAELQYGVTDANSLFELFNAGSGEVVIGDLIWMNASGLVGAPGDVVSQGSGFALLLDDSGNGLLSVAVPEPSSIVAFIIAFVVLSLVSFRRLRK